jgi:flagellar FliJ protein
MSKFRFRLATLLKLREAARDERRAALADAYQADEVLQGYLAKTQEDLVAVQQTYRQAISPGQINVDPLIDSQRYEMVMRAQVQHLDQQRAQLAEEIERRRQALVYADRDVRILEKLRDNQARQHAQTEEMQLMKILDEVAQRTGQEVDDR